MLYNWKMVLFGQKLYQEITFDELFIIKQCTDLIDDNSWGWISKNKTSSHDI